MVLEFQDVLPLVAVRLERMVRELRSVAPDVRAGVASLACGDVESVVLARIRTTRKTPVEIHEVRG
jgi:hypothetical protein